MNVVFHQLHPPVGGKSNQNLCVCDGGFYKDYSKGHMFSRGLSGLQLSVAAFTLNSLVTV